MDELDPLLVNSESMMAVMSKPPVLNSGTRFTSIMSAAAASYTTTVRTPAAGLARGGDNGEDTVRSARFLMRELVAERIPALAAMIARL
eukprot:SAG11_NODE_2707_length_3064_cov_1.595278_2_plen_89_part_00